MKTLTTHKIEITATVVLEADDENNYSSQNAQTITSKVTEALGGASYNVLALNVIVTPEDAAPCGPKK